MIKIHFLLVCFLGFFIIELNSSAVSFIKPCYADDKACLLSSAQAAVQHVAKGIPELKVPSVDPLYVKSVKQDDTNLKLEFYDVYIAGMSNAKIIELSRDTKENTIKVAFETPLKANGKYKLDGKIFIIHAFGEGDFEMDTDKAVIGLLITTKDIEKNGKKHWKVTRYTYNYDLLSKVNIKMNNLFGGDKKKAEPFNKLLDESWKEVVSEVGGPLIKDAIAEFMVPVKKFIESQPKEEFELTRN